MPIFMVLVFMVLVFMVLVSMVLAPGQVLHGSAKRWCDVVDARSELRYRTARPVAMARDAQYVSHRRSFHPKIRRMAFSTER